MVIQDERKTKAQLIEELDELRKKFEAGEQAIVSRRKSEESLRKSQTELELQLQERVSELEKVNDELRARTDRTTGSADMSAHAGSDDRRTRRFRGMMVLFLLLSLLLLILALYLYFGQIKPLEHQLASQQRQNEQLEEKNKRLDKPGNTLVANTRDEFVERIFFSSGKTGITSTGADALRKISENLKDVANKKIRIVGHSDDKPIRSRTRATYPSNWELSAFRAGTVARFLERQLGISPSRMEITGMGEYQAMGDNKSAEGRARNRRVEVFLAPTP